MISRDVICDICKKKCENGVWYQIYKYEGGYYTGKITSRADICNECFGKVLNKLRKGEEE